MKITNLLSSILGATLLISNSITAQAAELPLVVLETNQGDITIELEQERAPLSVENFLSYVDSGYYSGTIFHRVIPGFMAQGGGFTTDYQKKITEDEVKNEADNGLKNSLGTIAMARTSNPHSATSQFFINTANNGFLNHTRKSRNGWGYTVFGRVVEGMAVVRKIEKIKTGAGGIFGSDVPKEMVIINSAKRFKP